MARRDDALGVGGADTMIGSGVVVNGKLHSEGDIIIDGTVKGEIKASGHVTVGVNAEISAPIKAESAQIAGRVEGNITTVGETAIASTGHVAGDIISAGLAIESGGVFVGSSQIKTTRNPLPETSEESGPVKS